MMSLIDKLYPNGLPNFDYQETVTTFDINPQPPIKTGWQVNDAVMVHFGKNKKLRRIIYIDCSDNAYVKFAGGWYPSNDKDRKIQPRRKIQKGG